ncbi:MerR family transcriptional regulator [Roseburia hominis]
MTISEVSRKYGITQDTLRYYERVGVIPPVHRMASGLRDYTEEDCGWVELVKCMRSAGLSVEVLTEYVKLSRKGDSTIPDRLKLLVEQRKQLAAQLEVIRESMERLDYKISRYEDAVKTGTLNWD